MTKATVTLASKFNHILKYLKSYYTARGEQFHMKPKDEKNRAASHVYKVQ